VTETLTQAIPETSRIDARVPPRLLGEPVRVVYFAPQLMVGGMENQLADLLVRLNRERFQPFVWCPGPWGPPGDRLIDANIPVCRLRLSYRRPTSFVQSVHWIRQLKPRIFHSLGYADHWLDVLAARLARVPICITSRLNVRHWDQARRVRWSERLRNRWTDCVVANCDAVADVCAEVEEIPRHKIPVIYNGVELRESRPEPELRRAVGSGPTDLLVGNVANLKRVKGQDILIRAFRQVVDEVPQTRLVICGEGEEELSLKRLCEKLGLSKQVFFLGLCRTLNSVYGSLDLYVHSSRAEGFSNSILEAMAGGIPVVATTAGGTPELLGECARECLVPAEDPSALATAVVRMLKDKSLRARLGSAGQSSAAKRFTVPRMVAAYEALYFTLLSGAAQQQRCKGQIAGI